MNGPDRFVEYLQEHQYHPRSDAHSNAICQYIIEDLIETCPEFADRAAKGQVVAKLNLTQKVGHTDWTIDLAVGPPASGAKPPPNGELICWQSPAVIQIALEAKGVMTEHGKARRNRLRDLQAFHEHAHRYDENTIAVGVVVVNASEYFWSPTRDRDDVTVHRNIERLVAKTIDIYRGLPLIASPQDATGFEAVTVIVVKHDNLLKNPELPQGYVPQTSSLVSGSLAPQVSDPLHYSSMMYRVCEAFKERFC